MTAPAPARVAVVVEGFLTSYRRSWRGTLVTSFVSPVLFLLAIGVGLGGRVDDTGSLGGLSYLDFVAPGLLAATAMQIASTESTYPVMAGIKWLRTFHATLATPVGVPDLVAGRLAWVALRVSVSAAVFLLVTLPFGVAASPLAVLALPAALLTGLAFGAPLEALSAHVRQEAAFVGVFRFVVLPMFLFAGTFFPVDQLPAWLQVVAWCTPLAHGVALCRDLMTADAGPADLAHAAVLAAFAAVGAALALVAYRRRLEP